jgi:uncharacterized delta-60 repeat protein
VRHVVVCSASSNLVVRAESDGRPSAVALAARFVIEQLERRVLYSAGSIDKTFGPSGNVVRYYPAMSISDLAVQADGKIIALGDGDAFDADRGMDFTLARYNVDGTADTSFGDGGLVMTDFFGESDYAEALAITPDGKILAAGGAGTVANTNGHQRFAVVRYNADGSLDATFGAGGVAVAPKQSDADFVADVAALPDGKVLDLGYSWASVGDYTIMRFNADGSFDATFGGGDGIAKADLGAWDRAASLAMLNDGRFVAAGNGTGRSLQVARFNADGSIDSTFGVGGTVTFDGFRDHSADIIVQSDGGILLGGSAVSSRSQYASDLALLRLHADGSPDATFAADGRAVTTLATVAYSRDLVLQADGKIVQIAEIDGNTTRVLRYNPDGSLDTTFGVGGIVSNLNGDHVQAAAIGVNGKLLIGGATGWSGGFVIHRLTGDGPNVVDDDATDNVIEHDDDDDDQDDDGADAPAPMPTADGDAEQTTPDDGVPGDRPDPALERATPFAATTNDRLFAAGQVSPGGNHREERTDLLSDEPNPFEDRLGLEALLR